MKQSHFASCLLVVLLLTAESWAGLPSWVQLTPLRDAPNAVPFSVVRTVADQRTHALWPRAVSGEIVPYSDLDGTTIAYIFHYRTDRQPFPDYESAAEEIQAELPTLDNFGANSHYSYLLASARYDRAPILCYGKGGTEFFITLDRARARATQILGGSPILTRVYYIWPLSYYLFEVQGKGVVIEAHTMHRIFTPEEFRAYVEAGVSGEEAMIEGNKEIVLAQAARQMKAEWDRCLADSGHVDTVSTFVPQIELAPFYDWSYGCSPTAGTMVAGYLDAQRGYGRAILDRFSRWDSPEGEMDWNVPWAQRDMAIAMGTDTNTGGTYVSSISSGFRSFGTGKGYTFDVNTATGTSSNDWAWSTVTAEINSGNPMIWSYSWQNHSTSCFGYRTVAKDVYIHNTWWKPGTWFHYTNGGSSTVWIVAARPSGASNHNIRLLYPRGDTLYNHNGAGELLQVGRVATISWDNYFIPNDSVTIDISTNGGRNWTNLARGLPDNAAYDWNIPPTTPRCSTARIRIKAFYNGAYIAGDGSWGNFFLVTTPLPPTPLSPPNGRQLMSPPVILSVADQQYVDSFRFVLYNSTETLFTSRGTATACTVPSDLFEYRRIYNWVCQGHNDFGWGAYSTPWSFWAMFNQGVEDLAAENAELNLSTQGISRTPVAVRFALPYSGRASLVVFDATGRPLRNLLKGAVNAGEHNLIWNGLDDNGNRAPQGCYFVRLTHEGRSLVAKAQITLP